MESYGKELILDLHNCDVSKFNRDSLEIYLADLCDLISMKRENLYWWDYKGYPDEYERALAHLKGTSVVQFISTSNIVIHTLDELKNVYLNIFSCKTFDSNKVLKFTENFFKGEIVNQQTIKRI